MLSQISTPEDVVVFAKLLTKEGLNFHPDNDFKDYINLKTQQPTYRKAEADLRNNLMNQCFSVCAENGIDIYNAMCEIMLIETGMNKFIPLPSVSYSEQ